MPINDAAASTGEASRSTPSTKRSTSARSSEWRLWLLRSVWLLAALLLLWALAWLAVPPLLKSQAQKIASEKLGRPVTIGAIDFKPWSLELTVSDLVIAKLASAPAGAPQISIKRIYIDAEMQSLLRLAPVADAIQIDEPVLSLTHLGGGRLDIDDILERLKTPADKPASELLQFALYNLRLTGGQLDFTDQSVQKTHALRELTVAIPFLSNLQSQREIKTSPRLAFKLNGSSFDTAAEATPFADTRKTDASIKLSDFDLKPYLNYLPASLPFRLQGALLNADVKVAFEQTPATVVKLSGTMTATQVRLHEAASGAVPDLLTIDQVQLTLDDVRPLQQVAKISTVELTAPHLHVTRNRAGQLNVLPTEAANATKNIAAYARKTGATGQNGSKNAVPVVPASQPWKVTVGSIVMRGGKLSWRDETLAPAAQIALTNLTLDATGIAVPFVASAPVRFKGSLALDAAAQAPANAVARAPRNLQPNSSQPDSSRLNFSGSATDQAASVMADLASWPLSLASNYVGQFLLPALEGQVDARLGLNWQAANGDKPQALQITAPQLGLSNVQLTQGKTALVSVKRVDVTGIDVDVPTQSFKAAKLQLTEPKALVERAADKSWMFERWRVAQSRASAEKGQAAAAPGKAAPLWAIAINDVGIDGGAVSFSDKAAGAKPVAFQISALKAQLGNLMLGEGRASAQAKAAMPLTASLRLASGGSAPGEVDFKGNLGLAPMQVQGQLAVIRLPVQAFEPYFADAVNVELLRADASFKGKVAYQQRPTGPQAQVSGDAVLEAFKANTAVNVVAPAEELLTWKALQLSGLSVALTPAQATRVDVKETVLTDFFARVIVTPEGRINLQDLLKKPGEASVTAAPPTSADATKIVADRARNTGATASKDPQAAAQAPAQASAQAPAAIVNFGPLSLINGKVLFSDRFIKPNYTANLTELNGKLSAFSSEAPAGNAAAPVNMAALAELELRGRAEGTASLEIVGKLNPLAKPLALDITGKVRDLELPPLSPYAIKYAGYGINRGKMSVDVNYVVLPNGQLTAKNKLVLNQLSFGDKVEGAPASLPVKLAVALLADRNGVIDLDLPISGSLNDPQFSLGPVIVKVILNVITRAITAPFSLLANAFGGGGAGGGGGGDELGRVSFAAGSARLTPDAEAGLDKVAKALKDRPALKLTVVGTSNLDAERDGFKRERLDEMVRAEKRRTTGNGDSPASADSAISPADYPALLKEVYQRADMPKPRNALGLTKDLPDAEMEKLLLADIRVSDDAMRELAVRRGVVVKDYLAAANLPADRLVLGASKTAASDPKWTPGVELNLASP